VGEIAVLSENWPLAGVFSSGHGGLARSNAARREFWRFDCLEPATSLPAPSQFARQRGRRSVVLIPCAKALAPATVMENQGGLRLRTDEICPKDDARHRNFCGRGAP
jgi:hypothetical protein